MTTPSAPPAPVPPPPQAPSESPAGSPPEARGGPAPQSAPAWSVPAASTDQGQDWTLRLLGAVLAVAVTDPPGWFSGSPARLLIPLFAVLGALAAAGPVSLRPVLGDYRWLAKLGRYRNTLFGAGCLLLAAVFRPPVWLAGCDTALLLSYLLLLDAVVGGPPAADLLRRPLALLSVYAGCAVVLAAALVPVATTGSWARLVAALALAASGTGVLAAIRLRHRAAARRRPPER